MTPTPDRGSGFAAGLGYVSAAYVLWGILPVYFVALAPSGPIEIVSWRIVLSLAFCILLIVATRGWARIRGLLRDRRAMGWLALAAVLITANWLVFVYAVDIGNVLEASLGYFINPIVSVLIGVLLLRERLRPLQWAAVAIAAVAVVTLIAFHGSFPWIALTLACSFGIYGYVKNRTGGRVDAISGLSIETAVLTPLAIAVLGWVQLTGGISLGQHGAWHTALLLAAGVITAVPLLLFAAGARRLPLSIVGLVQFFAPVMQFLTGWLLLGEPMPLSRWLGFGIVWVAVIVLGIDMARQIPMARRAQRARHADRAAEGVGRGFDNQAE